MFISSFVCTVVLLCAQLYAACVFKASMKRDGVMPLFHLRLRDHVAFRAQHYEVHGKLRTANVIMQIIHA